MFLVALLSCFFRQSRFWELHFALLFNSTMPTFNPEKPFGERFESDNDYQAGFVSLFADFAMWDPQPRGDELFELIRDAMSPSYLVDPDICKKLPIYGKVKTFLEKFDVDVPVTDESGSLVAKRLICRIWNGDEYLEDRRRAFDQFDEFRNGQRSEDTTRTSYNAGSPRTSTQPSNNPRQISNDVAKRFSNDSSKFSGDETECWPKYVESYTRMSDELELDNRQMMKFFHHLLRDHALEFYREHVENQVSSFNDIEKKMNEQFFSALKMETVARRLEALHISQFEDAGKSEEESLREIAKNIQTFVPQTPMDFRTDRYRKKILNDATCGKEWALNISSSTSFRNLSYQQLLNELLNSLQQYNIHKKRSENKGEEVLYRRNIAETNFIGQGRYVKSRNHYGNQYGHGQRSSENRLNRCWNCMKPNCTVNRCPYPKNPKKIRLNRIKHFEAKSGTNFDKRVTETLFEFSEQYIDENSDDDTEEPDEEEETLDSDERTAEIQHILSENREQYCGAVAKGRLRRTSPSTAD